MNWVRLLVTGILSISISCGIGYLWLRAHPSPRLVLVNVGSLFEEQKRLLASRIKPGMTEEEQKAIFQVAAEYGNQVEDALSAVANECQCGVLNSAALVRMPDVAEIGIADATDRVRQLLAKK
jgi:hypothetical protein